MTTPEAPQPRHVAVILLAAGAGTRFGGEKLSCRLSGRPVWEWSAQAGEGAGFESRIVVVRSLSELPEREGWTRMVNSDAHHGMGTSIAAGIAAAIQADRAVIALADMPLMTADHLKRLRDAHGTVFTHQSDGKVGNPAGFDRETFEALRSLAGDQGARTLDLGDVEVIDAEHAATLADIDSPADLENLTRQWLARPTAPRSGAA